MADNTFGEADNVTWGDVDEGFKEGFKAAKDLDVPPGQYLVRIAQLEPKMSNPKPPYPGYPMLKYQLRVVRNTGVEGPDATQHNGQIIFGQMMLNHHVARAMFLLPQFTRAVGYDPEEDDGIDALVEKAQDSLVRVTCKMGKDTGYGENLEVSKIQPAREEDVAFVADNPEDDDNPF